MVDLNRILCKAQNLNKSIVNTNIDNSYTDWIKKSSTLKKESISNLENSICSFDIKQKSKISKHYFVELFISPNTLLKVLKTKFEVNEKPIYKNKYKVGFKIFFELNGYKLETTLLFSQTIDKENAYLKIFLSEVPIINDPTGGLILKSFLLKKSLELGESIQNLLDSKSIIDPSQSNLSLLSPFNITHVTYQNGFRFLSFENRTNNLNKLQNYSVDCFSFTQSKVRDLFSNIAKNIDDDIEVLSDYNSFNNILNSRIKLDKVIKTSRHCGGPKLHYKFELKYKQFIKILFLKRSPHSLSISVTSIGGPEGDTGIRNPEEFWLTVSARCGDKQGKILAELAGYKLGTESLLKNINIEKNIDLENLNLSKNPYFQENTLIFEFN